MTQAAGRDVLRLAATRAACLPERWALGGGGDGGVSSSSSSAASAFDAAAAQLEERLSRLLLARLPLPEARTWLHSAAPGGSCR